MEVGWVPTEDGTSLGPDESLLRSCGAGPRTLTVLARSCRCIRVVAGTVFAVGVLCSQPLIRAALFTLALFGISIEKEGESCVILRALWRCPPPDAEPA
jgi:hypothetical protein